MFNLSLHNPEHSQHDFEFKHASSRVDISYYRTICTASPTATAITTGLRDSKDSIFLIFAPDETEAVQSQIASQVYDAAHLAMAGSP